MNGTRNFSESDWSEKECEEVIEKFRNESNASFEEELGSLYLEDGEAECILNHYKEKRVAEILMEKLIYENSLKITKDKREEKTHAIYKSVEKQKFTAIKLCQFKIQFIKSYFDYLYKKYRNNEPKSSPDKEFCARKYIVENNYIDTSVYHVNLNPLNIDTSEIDCDEILKASKETSETAIESIFEDTSLVPKCLKKALNDHNLGKILARTCVYGEIGLSDEALNEQRSLYLEETYKLCEDFAKC